MEHFPTTEPEYARYAYPVFYYPVSTTTIRA